MSKKGPPGLMDKVALLRVAGKSWGEIALEVPRAGRTLEDWPLKRAQEWNAALRAAIDRMLATFEHEALLAARADLQSADAVVRARAYSALLNHCRWLRGLRQRMEITGPGGGPILTTTDLVLSVREALAAGTGRAPEPQDREPGARADLTEPASDGKMIELTGTAPMKGGPR